MGIKIASKSMNPQGYKKYSDSLKKKYNTKTIYRFKLG